MRGTVQNTLGPLDLAELLSMQPPKGVLSVLALGTFDGVHAGHRAILHDALATRDRLQQESASQVQAVAFTFDNLPLEVLRPERAPARLMTTRSRCEHILQVGMDQVVLAKFDSTFAQQQPEVYVERILFSGFHVGAVVVGFNHTFGYQGRGNVALLKEIAKRHGVEVHVVSEVTLGDRPVSSTVIRRLLNEGACGEAAKLLGRPYYLEGTVVDGFKQGRLLGYPTANLQPDVRLLVPGDGVYLTRVEGERNTFGYALTVVSTRPTFGDHDRSVEAHILDYTGDLYGTHLRIHFLEYLRGITRFSGPEALKAQIDADVRAARERIPFFESMRPSFT